MSMNLFGSLRELLQLVLRKDSRAIIVRPNQSVTYTADRDVQLPPEDANSALVSETATQTLSGKDLSGNKMATVSPDGVETLTLPVATDTLVGRDTTDTLSSKTLSTPNVNGSLDIREETTPTNPVAGRYRIYPKGDGNLYILDSSGTESQVGIFTQVYPLTSSGNLTITPTQNFWHPALEILAADTYTVDAGGRLTTSAPFIIDGSLVINGNLVVLG